LPHPDSFYQQKKRKEREKEPMAPYISALVINEEGKNDLILVLSTYALSHFSLYTFRNDEKRTEGNSLFYYSISFLYYIE
jgi:hypothetical protein